MNQPRPSLFHLARNEWRSGLHLLGSRPIETETIAVAALGLNVVGMIGTAMFGFNRLSTATKIQEQRSDQQERAFREALTQQEKAFRLVMGQVDGTLTRLDATVSHLDRKLDDHAQRLTRMEERIRGSIERAQGGEEG